MTTRNTSQSPVQTTMTAAPVRPCRCRRRTASAAARRHVLIHLFMPLLLLGGCATVSPPGQSERAYVVIGDGPSGPRTLLLQPVDGELISPFGWRKDPRGGGGGRIHRGIDLGAPFGAEVRAAGDGVVIDVGPRGNYGHYVRIQHDGTYETAYSHLSRYAVAYRDRVKQGEVIGYVGSSGNASGPHLHYEILEDGVQVDPFEVGPSLADIIKDGAVDAAQEAVNTIKDGAVDAAREAVNTIKDAAVDAARAVVDTIKDGAEGAQPTSVPADG